MQACRGSRGQAYSFLISELYGKEWDNNIKVQIKKCGGDWLYVGQAKM